MQSPISALTVCPSSPHPLRDSAAREAPAAAPIEVLRIDPQLGLSEVEVDLHLETKGPEHCALVLGELREAGYVVSH